MNRTLIDPHGGYRHPKVYQMAEIVYDGTVVFCHRFIGDRSRVTEQMVQAAHSGKQNIAEGEMASATSRETELELIRAARASLEKLLLDYQDFLRQRKLPAWNRDDGQAQRVRHLAARDNGSYSTYKSQIERQTAEVAANTLICLIHHASYLLDRLLRQLEKSFLEDGGVTERLYRLREEVRRETRLARRELGPPGQGEG